MLWQRPGLLRSGFDVTLFYIRFLFLLFVPRLKELTSGEWNNFHPTCHPFTVPACLLPYCRSYIKHLASRSVFGGGLASPIQRQTILRSHSGNRDERNSIRLVWDVTAGSADRCRLL